MFDEDNRLILRDHSQHGTIVTYSGKGRGLRRHFMWIAGGHKPLKQLRKIVSEIQSLPKFQIVVFAHNINSPRYARSVNQFREGEAHVEDLIEALYLPSSPETKPVVGACTPRSGPLLIDTEVIERGAFATVSCSWDVTTRHKYACKRPVRPTFDVQCWKPRADILGGVDHASQPNLLLPPQCLTLITHQKHDVRLLDFHGLGLR